MQVSQAVRISAWALIGLNLLMAFGAIAIFVRMTPAIEQIIERNERSLQAGEDMLAALTLARLHVGDRHDAQRDRFQAALQRAQDNVTEDGEPEALAIIAQRHVAAFTDESTAIQATVAAIRDLTHLNRRAMRLADEHAQQLGTAGAWGMVFMALTLLGATLVFITTIRRRVIAPLEEIHDVLISARRGDHFRRCVGDTLPSRELLGVYRELNALLDERLAHVDERSATF